MKYQIADLNNGPFGEIFDNLEAAEAALAEAIEEGQKINDDIAKELDLPAEDASEFFSIVEVYKELVCHGTEELHIPTGSGIAQVIFHLLAEDGEYNGKYQNQEDKPIRIILE